MLAWAHRMLPRLRIYISVAMRGESDSYYRILCYNGRNNTTFFLTDNDITVLCRRIGVHGTQGCYWNYVNIPAQIILAMLWMGQFGHKARQLTSPHALQYMCAVHVRAGQATTQGAGLIAFLSGNAFDADNLPNYHNDHIRGVGGSGHVMLLT